MYVSFGIQRFVTSPHNYVAHRAQETVVERHLRWWGGTTIGTILKT
jgi:hypothetical protein